MKQFILLLVSLLIMLMQTSSPAQAQQADYDGLDIVFLVDQSGSMGRILGGAAPNDKLGLRFYSLPLVTSLMGDYRLLVNNQASFRMAVVNFGETSEPWRFSLSGSYWQTIAPNSKDEWKPQYDQIVQDFQKMEDEFSMRDLGTTNFLGAFETARSLFTQIPDLPGSRLRVVITLTDGQPSLNVPGFSADSHMSALSAYANSYFPEPDYRIFTIGMIDATDSYWQLLESYWETITNDPCTSRACTDKSKDRAGLVASNNDVGKRFQEILRALTDELSKPDDVTVVDADISPGPLTVPPYLKFISFAYFKTDPAQRLVLTDPQGVIDGNRSGVEIEGLSGPIQVVRISNPIPGRWQVATDPRGVDVDITMRYIFAKSLLDSPSAGQVQFVPLTIKYTLLDEVGQPLPMYNDPLYKLLVNAKVSANGQTWDLTLNEDGQGGYSAEFVPIVTGSHAIEVRAESQDFDGKQILVFEGEIGSFDVSPVQIVAKDLPQTWQQYSQQPITFELQDARGFAVNAPSSLQATITIDDETLSLTPQANGSYEANYTPQRTGTKTVHALVTVRDANGMNHTIMDADIGTFEVVPTTRVDIQVLEPAQPKQPDTGLVIWLRNPLVLHVRLQDEDGNPLDPRQIFAPSSAGDPLTVTAMQQDTGESVNIPLIFRPTAETGEFIAQSTEYGIGDYIFTIAGTKLNPGYVYRQPQTSVRLTRVRHPLYIPVLITGILLAIAAVASGTWWTAAQINLRKHPCRGRIVIADLDGVQKFQKPLDSYGLNHIVIPRKEIPAILKIRKMEFWCESDSDSNNKKTYVRIWREGDRVALTGLDGKLLLPGSEVRLGNAPFWLYKDPDELREHPEARTDID
jgi:hypothetical protein